MKQDEFQILHSSPPLYSNRLTLSSICIIIVELSRRTALAKTTLTSMIDRMEASGILVRSYDKSDRRQTRIILTDKAKALNGKYEEVSEEMIRLFYKDFTE